MHPTGLLLCARGATFYHAPLAPQALSETFEVEIVAVDAEILDDVSDDSARHVAGMPGERDQAIGAEGIRIVAVAASRANGFAANLTQSPVKLAAVPGRILALGSRDEDELVAKRRRNGASRFQQRFEVRLGRDLKSQGGLAPVPSVGVTAGQQG